MISFEKLGKHEGLGNQLFQYAFLRTTAQRLGTTFYCPSWLGEEIFLLNDQGVKSSVRSAITKNYRQPDDTSGFSPSALMIEDGTEIFGFFQSERYFNADEVRRWYTFKPEAVARVAAQYSSWGIEECTGLHLRFGDMTHNPLFVILPARYYRKALSLLNDNGPLLVFSDDLATAKRHLSGIKKDFRYVEGNKDYEDLYLLSRCRNVICSVSTFSWWGGWLNPRANKCVIAPREWLRPGHVMTNTSLSREEWTMLTTCRPVLDDYRFLMKKKLWRERFLRMKQRGFKEQLATIGRYARRKWDQ